MEFREFRELSDTHATRYLHLFAHVIQLVHICRFRIGTGHVLEHIVHIAVAFETQYSPSIIVSY